MYDYLDENITKDRICTDETSVKVIRDGRESMTNSYMWVYRTGSKGGIPSAILYEFQKTRKADHPREFLKDYKGVVVFDGYQVYHKQASE